MSLLLLLEAANPFLFRGDDLSTNSASETGNGYFGQNTGAVRRLAFFRLKTPVWATETYNYTFTTFNEDIVKVTYLLD